MARWKLEGRIYKVAGINDLPVPSQQPTWNHVFTLEPPGGQS